MFQQVNFSFANVVLRILFFAFGVIALVHFFNILYNRIPNTPPPGFRSSKTMQPATETVSEPARVTAFRPLPKPEVKTIEVQPVYTEKPLAAPEDKVSADNPE